MHYLLYALQQSFFVTALVWGVSGPSVNLHETPSWVGASGQFPHSGGDLLILSLPSADKSGRQALVLNLGV